MGMLGPVIGHGHPGRRGTPWRRPLPPASWRALVDAATRERVVGLLAAAVADGLPVDDAQAAEVQRLAASVAFRSMLLDRALGASVPALAAAGVPVRLLKGLALGRLLYPAPSWRQTGDVDLACRPEHFATADRVLRRLGGQPVADPVYGATFGRLAKGATYALGGVHIDLHHHVIGTARRFRLADDDLHGAAQPVPLLPDGNVGPGAGVTVLAPAPEVMVVHAALHLASRNARLSTVPDLAWLLQVPALDLDAVAGVARRSGAVALLQWALRETDRWIAIEPGRLRPLLALPTDRAERVALATLLRYPHLAPLADGLELAWPDRARLLHELVWPTDAFLRERARTRRGHVRHLAAQVGRSFGRRSGARALPRDRAPAVR